MGAIEPSHGDPGQARPAASGPGGLLDVLRVAAILLDAEGRIDLWSPQAEELFGYTAEEALGEFAGHLLLHEEHLPAVLDMFAEVMEVGVSWVGVFPVRHKDGSTRMVEFRNMRLLDSQQEYYALGLAADQATVRQLERDLALSARLVDQSPVGLGVLDTDLRYVSVNPAEERLNGVSAAEHVGRHVHEVLPAVDPSFEAAMREVLATGVPIVDQYTVGRTPADPDHDHAWSISFYRLEPPTEPCSAWPPPAWTSPSGTGPSKNNATPHSPSSAACCRTRRRGGRAWKSPPATAPHRPRWRSAATGST